MTRAARWLLLAAVALAGGCGRGVPIERVVLVTLDTTRADRLGAYGYEHGKTGHLDAIARESVLFENAVAAVPTTLASHSTMFTGVYPHDHGVRYNLRYRLGDGATTLAEILRAQGFATAGFPASFVVAERFGARQGFDHWVEPPQPRLGGGEPPETQMRSAEEIVDSTLAWLGQQGDRRVFAWVHFYDPHYPYRPPFPYSDEFRDRPYDGEIAYVDAQFGRLVERLRSDPQWKRTLLVVAADHGEGLHDHRERFHGDLVYESTQHVPFFIRDPAARPRRVAEPVTLADVMPTIVARVGAPVPSGIRGISLVPALEGASLPRRDLYFESVSGNLNYGWAELRGVRYGSWKLIDSPAPELFDLERDPGEQEDLARAEAQRVVDLQEVLGRLSEPVAGTHAAEAAHDAVLDPETEALMASLGYMTGSSGGSGGEGGALPREMIDLSIEMLSAQMAVQQNRWDQVGELCEYVLSRDPRNKWALQNRVSALVHQSRYREAQDAGAELVREYPDHSRSYELFARAYQADGRPDVAYRVLRQGRKELPEEESLAYYSLVAAFEAGRPDVCEEVAAEAGAFATSWRLRVLDARCAARRGETEAALRELERAYEMGLRGVELLAADDEDLVDFREVVELPGFKALVERERQAARAS